MASMIKLRHQQPSLWHSGLAADIEDLWEPWMWLVDGLLEDEQLLETIYEAQGKRYPQSRRRGREQTPAEVVLRLLLLKHIRNWSYDVLEREVRANLVYRAFTRVGDGKVPDAKTMARLGQLIGPEVIEELHQRIVQLAQEHGVTRGRKLRVDTTVVETQHPLSDRQQFVGGRHAGADADDEEDRAEKRRPEAQGAGSHAECAEAGSGDCPIDPAPGSGRRSPQKEAVWRTAEFNPENREPGATHIRRGEESSPSSSCSPGKLSGDAGHDEGAGAASHETNQAANLCRRDPGAGKDREHVRAAHGNHSQRQGQQADRVWQTGQDPGIGKSNHQSLRSVRRASQRPAVVGAVDRGSPAEIRPDSGVGGRGCGIPLAAE